jgi:hypothetical protein
MKNILFLEASIQTLRDKTLIEFPSRLVKAIDIADSLISDDLVFHFNPRSKTLLVLAKITGSDPMPYVTTMLFDKTQESPTGVSIESGGKPFNIDKFTDPKNNCKVRCTCKDFMWTFNYYNKKDNSLRGHTRDPYIKKTSRPPRNPGESSGLCKHLLALYIKLEQMGLV